MPDEASAGARRVVLLRGDAGAGKVHPGSGVPAVDGLDRVIWATADPEESRLPFGVVDQLARQLQTTSGTDARILDRTRREPFLEGVTLLRWLDEAQIDGVVVLVIDDVQHTDAQSSAALAFSLRRLHSDRVLTVMTTRPDEEVQIAAGLLRLIAARGVKITLGGLTDDRGDGDVRRCRTDPRDASAPPSAFAFTPTAIRSTCERSWPN